MATTIINSMSVKPFCTCLNINELLLMKTKQSNLRQRPAPVIGIEQALCQGGIGRLKSMNYKNNFSNLQTLIDISTSASGVMSDETRHPMTIFVSR
jgi:hypothetical protein